MKKPNSFSDSFQKVSYVIPFYYFFVNRCSLINFLIYRILLSLQLVVTLITILFTNHPDVFVIAVDKLNNIKISHCSFIVCQYFKIHHSKAIVFLIKTVINIFKFIFFTFQIMLFFLFFIKVILL